MALLAFEPTIYCLLANKHQILSNLGDPGVTEQATA